MKHSTGSLTALCSLILACGVIACSSSVDLAGQRQKIGAEEGGSTPPGTGGGSSGGAQGTNGDASAMSNGGGTAGSACGDGCQSVELRATGDGSQNLSSVAPGEERELCSSFHLDAAAGSHATLANPLVDNADLLHDMSLFKMSSPQTNGFAQVCPTNAQNGRNLGVPPEGGTLEWSWQSGTGETAVAFEIPPGDFILATHYVNTLDHPQSDHSGVALCVCGN